MSSIPLEDELIETDREPTDMYRKKRKKLVLIVEDNEDMRFYLKDNLKAQHQVIEAANGKEGWDKVKSQMPDLVVSDMMMPEMNGLELAKK